MTKPKLGYTPVEPSYAERQAAIRKAFMALQTAQKPAPVKRPGNVLGRAPTRARVVHTFLPDDGMREAGQLSRRPRKLALAST
jgi:hypothetical protein